MKTRNSYDIKLLYKDLAKLKKSAQQAANKATVYTVEQASAIHMTFDETEVVPYIANEEGNIVISVKNSSPAALEELLSAASIVATETLKQDFIGNMKEAMK